MEIRKRIWFAAITAAVSVPLIIAVLFVSLANVWLTRPEVYHQALLRQDLYTRFSGIAARQLAFYFHQEGISIKNIREDIPAQNGAHHLQDVLPLLSRLSQADWEQILNSLLPPALLRQEIEASIDQAVANITQSGASGRIDLSTREIKTLLGSGEGMSAFLRLMRAQRPCVVQGANANIADRGLTVPDCRPSEEELLATIPQYRWVLQGIAGDIPDEYNLVELLPAHSSVNSTAAGQHQATTAANVFVLPHRLHLAALYSPVFPGLLLFVTALAAVRSGRDLLRWWGGPLALAGLISLALAAGLQPALNGWVTRVIYTELSPYFTPDLVNLLSNVAHAIVAPLGRSFALGALGLIMVGGLMLGSSTLLRSRSWTSTPRNSEES